MFVRQNAAAFGGDTGRLVLAGWSLGSKAAMAAAMDPCALDGWRPCAVVGIAGGYTRPEPLTGRAPIDALTRAGESLPAIPIMLIHGSADPAVDVQQSRQLHAALQHRGWPTSLDEPDTDHAGVIMTEYDPESGRCRPSHAEHAVRAGHQTAHLIARTANLAPRPC